MLLPLNSSLPTTCVTGNERLNCLIYASELSVNPSQAANLQMTQAVWHHQLPGFSHAFTTPSSPAKKPGRQAGGQAKASPSPAGVAPRPPSGRVRTGSATYKEIQNNKVIKKKKNKKPNTTTTRRRRGWEIKQRCFQRLRGMENLKIPARFAESSVPPSLPHTHTHSFPPRRGHERGAGAAAVPQPGIRASPQLLGWRAGLGSSLIPALPRHTPAGTPLSATRGGPARHHWQGLCRCQPHSQRGIAGVRPFWAVRPHLSAPSLPHPGFLNYPALPGFPDGSDLAPPGRGLSPPLSPGQEAATHPLFSLPSPAAAGSCLSLISREGLGPLVWPRRGCISFQRANEPQLPGRGERPRANPWGTGPSPWFWAGRPPWARRPWPSPHSHSEGKGPLPPLRSVLNHAADSPPSWPV